MRLVNTVLVTFIAFSGILFFYELFFNQDRRFLDWRYYKNEDHGSGRETTAQEGSQYLLGVGKADITGYAFQPLLDGM